MGQPGIVKQYHSGNGRQTRRTETSKYPEENKANAIPQVEAIEKGTAQTVIVSAIAGL